MSGEARQEMSYVIQLSLVAKDMVSLSIFCSKPEPMPKATACNPGTLNSLY